MQAYVKSSRRSSSDVWMRGHVMESPHTHARTHAPHSAGELGSTGQGRAGPTFISRAGPTLMNTLSAAARLGSWELRTSVRYGYIAQAAVQRAGAGTETVLPSTAAAASPLKLSVEGAFFSTVVSSRSQGRGGGGVHGRGGAAGGWWIAVCVCVNGVGVWWWW